MRASPQGRMCARSRMITPSDERVDDLCSNLPDLARYDDPPAQEWAKQIVSWVAPYPVNGAGFDSCAPSPRPPCRCEEGRSSPTWQSQHYSEIASRRLTMTIRPQRGRCRKDRLPQTKNPDENTFSSGFAIKGLGHQSPCSQPRIVIASTTR